MADHTQIPQPQSTKLDQDLINNLPHEGNHVITFVTDEDMQNALEQIRRTNLETRLTNKPTAFKPIVLRLLSGVK